MMRFTASSRSRSWVLGMLIGCLALPAFAGVFTVTPVRIYMAPRDRATAITITNESDEELVMQADIYDWKQKPDGQDELTLTEDMFLSPPIIKMAPKSRQVVRLALLHPPVLERQLTYRMIVREIPEAKPSQKDLQLQVALAFSMPVFITPPNAKAKLDCKVERVAVNTVKAVCENAGIAYSHPVDFLLTNGAGDKIASQESGAYILPGIIHSFDLKRAEGNILAGTGKLKVTLDDGTSESYEISIPE
jgi:fimbrial chaperone protein